MFRMKCKIARVIECSQEIVVRATLLSNQSLLSRFLFNISPRTVVRKIDHAMGKNNEFRHILQRLSPLFLQDEHALFSKT